ncbi:MAG: ThiF family adenylyltransferase [Phycisphaerales bacterium]
MNDSPLHRYHRQMLLPDFGEPGQRRLASARALLVGCGALGSMIAELLARAGVGHLVIVDRDFVETTNLQRQVLFDETDARDAMPKAVAAQRKLAAINSTVRVDAVVADFNPANAEQLADNCSVLLDGTDNFETRYLLNDLAVKHDIPLVCGGAVGSTGTAWSVLPGQTPCWRCLHDDAPVAAQAGPTCDTAGVLGPVACLIASIQSAEALKILLGRRDRVHTGLRSFDLWANTQQSIDLAAARRDDCPCCARHQFDYLTGLRQTGVTTLCGRNAVQVMPHRPLPADQPLDFEAVAARLAPHGPTHFDRYRLRATIDFSGQPLTLTLFTDGRAIIQGTSEPLVARTLYSRYIGM